MSAFTGSASTDRTRARKSLDYPGARYYGKNKNWNKHLVNRVTLYMYNTWWRGGKRKELRACKYVSGIWILAWISSDYFESLLLPQWRVVERRKRLEAIGWISGYLNICIKKVDAKCWLAEIWPLSQQGATGELKEPFNFQKRSCKLSFLFLPRRDSASESLLAGYGNLVCSFLHSLTGAVTEHASLIKKGQKNLPPWWGK